MSQQHWLLDLSNDPVQASGISPVYEIDYASLSIANNPTDTSHRIIGRGNLPKPKCVLEREAALRIFNRTVSAAIANNKFRDTISAVRRSSPASGSRPADSGRGRGKSRSKSAPATRINQYVRAVEAGLRTEHLAPGVSTLRVPISLAWVRRERRAMTIEMLPKGVDIEAERQRTRVIQQKIKHFLTLLDLEER